MNVYMRWCLCASSKDGTHSSQGPRWLHEDVQTQLQFFQQDGCISKFQSIKSNLRGAEYVTAYKNTKKWSALNGAPRERKMWVFLHYLIYFLASSQNHVLEKEKKDGIPFPVLVLLVFHIMPMLPHIHLIPNLDSIVIPKDYIGEGRP